MLTQSIICRETIGYVQCSVRDILVLYLAKQSSTIKTSEKPAAILQLKKADSNEILKDENGFPTQVALFAKLSCVLLV